LIEEVEGVRSIEPASREVVDSSEEAVSSFLRRRMSPRSDFSAKPNPLSIFLVLTVVNSNLVPKVSLFATEVRR
jgi:hypothetical protein